LLIECEENGQSYARNDYKISQHCERKLFCSYFFNIKQSFPSYKNKGLTVADQPPNAADETAENTY